jgi:hypothetical protein
MTTENNIQAPDAEDQKPTLPPRGERHVKLVTKDGTEISCSIMPTLMWIKTKFKELVRRQQITNSKLAGIEERRKTRKEISELRRCDG